MMTSGSVRHDLRGTARLPRETAERLEAGETLKLRFLVEIFETSVPCGHLWCPASGDFRILWRSAVEGTLPHKEARRQEEWTKQGSDPSLIVVLLLEQQGRCREHTQSRAARRPRIAKQDV